MINETERIVLGSLKFDVRRITKFTGSEIVIPVRYLIGSTDTDGKTIWRNPKDVDVAIRVNR